MLKWIMFRRCHLCAELQIQTVVKIFPGEKHVLVAILHIGENPESWMVLETCDVRWGSLLNLKRSLEHLSSILCKHSTGTHWSVTIFPSAVDSVNIYKLSPKLQSLSTWVFSAATCRSKVHGLNNGSLILTSNHSTVALSKNITIQWFG
jgi:hypothetical protein